MQCVSSARLLVWAAALCALLPTAGPTRAASDPDLVLEVAGLDVAVWQPTGGPGPYPLVLFSHGLLGCNTQSTYLMRALAEHGMLVVAPDHEDRGANCPERLPTKEELATILSGSHLLDLLLNPRRGGDLLKLRAALPDDPRLSTWTIDPDRVVLIGHSLGGYTVLRLAGAQPSGQTHEIAAVVALAPFVLPFLEGGTVQNISAPVLLQGGDRDKYTPSKDHDAIFARLKSPACKVAYAAADHFAWTDLHSDELTDLEATELHDATAAATTAFLDEVFAGRPLNEAVLARRGTVQSQVCK